MAPPPTTIERLANVPQPYGVASVSPWRTSTRSGVSPSRSAATWESVVWWPWPWPEVPTDSSTEPDGSMRTSAVS